jgi:hypothetical protein
MNGRSAKSSLETPTALQATVPTTALPDRLDALALSHAEENRAAMCKALIRILIVVTLVASVLWAL